MLPLREVRDRGTPRRPPLVIAALIVLNVGAFVFEEAMIESGVTRFPLDWGLVPRVLTDLDPLHGALTIFTSMFLHGGWLHLLGNLWFLWIFGPAVEDVLGHARFAALYLLGGVAAAAAQVMFDPSSTAPMIGASGAIGAVLAAFVSLYPMRRISTIFVPLPLVFAIPSFVFVLEWFALNLFQGIGALGWHPDAAGGVAWWAHVGGFLSGLLLVRLLFPRRDDDRIDPIYGGPVHGGHVVVRDERGERVQTSRGDGEDRYEAQWQRW